MRLNARKDIEAPAAFVFSVLKDFDGWERSALRRGADVTRTDRLIQVQPGLTWSVKFRYRGRNRQLSLKLVEITAPSQLAFEGEGASFNGHAALDLIELALQRSRLSVTLEVKPKSIAARMILQSFKLARTKLNQRFDDRVAQIGAEIEHRYRQTARI